MSTLLAITELESMTDKFQFFHRAKYFEELQARIDQAGMGDRVSLASMTFTADGPTVRGLVKALAGAAERGADVRLAVDAICFMLDLEMVKPGPLLYGSSMERTRRQPHANIHRVMTELSKAGVSCVVLNRPARPFTNPLAGRSHIKFAAINDWVAIGGVNIDDSWQDDAMVGWDDTKAAGLLHGLANKLVESQTTRGALGGKDQIIDLREDVRVLIDAGKPGQSSIFDEAMRLIDEAHEHVLLTCQYYPNDTTVKHLLAADNRGVKVKIVYNHPNQHPGPYRILHHGVLAAMKLKLPKHFFVHPVMKGKPFMHAKVIATDRGAMIGSHNYVTAGVKLGTAEMALEVRTVGFAGQAELLVAEMLA